MGFYIFAVMTKIKHLFLLICIAGCLAACSKNNPVDNFDYEAQYKLDTAAIGKYVKEKGIPAVKHSSGVYYQIIEPGTGSVTYNDGTNVTVDYEGRLLDGTVFDSSRGNAVTLTLGNLITGWRIGIPLIQKGGKIRLLIPSYLGYGNVAKGPIPKNSILDFTVNLTDVR